MPEVEIIEKVQKGDMQAFEQLFELYKSKALKTAYLMTGDKVVSEDVVQEAFIKCYRSIKELRQPQYFHTWFYKLLTRTAWQYLKKERQIMPVEDISEMLEKDCVKAYSEKLEDEATANMLYEEIAKLDPKLQMTLILFYYDGFSVKEIAHIMGCFEGTVKSRLHTGRKKLQKSLTAQHIFFQREVLQYENK